MWSEKTYSCFVLYTDIGLSRFPLALSPVSLPHSRIFDHFAHSGQRSNIRKCGRETGDEASPIPRQNSHAHLLHGNEPALSPPPHTHTHTEVTPTSVTLNDGRVIPCGMVVWSTGLAPR